MSDERGRTLAMIARRAIASALGAPHEEDPDLPWLREEAATFVTITRLGELHGCVGSIEARRSLASDVRNNAVAAALRDPRSTFLTLSDMDQLRIEISLLSPLEPIPFKSETEALAALRPHIDGVVLVFHGRRATFLPQVWAKVPKPAEFMAQLKQKAGLPPDFWAPDVELFRYSLEKWKEPAPANSTVLDDED